MCAGSITGMIAPAGAGASSATSASAQAATARLCLLVLLVLCMTQPSDASDEALISGDPLAEPPLLEPGGGPLPPAFAPQLIDPRHRLLRRHPLGRRQEGHGHRPQAELEQAAAV